MKFVTFNIRYSWDADGINSFLHRFGAILYKLDTEKPDVVCFQEATDRMCELLRRHLPDYEFTGCGREKDFGGETMLTAVRKETFSVLSSETFWLSPTPLVPGSRHEGQNVCPRTCNLPVIRENGGGRTVRVYNAHLDYEKESIRVLEARQVADRITADTNGFALPVILAGDFNAGPSDGSVLEISKAKPSLTDLAAGFENTFHNFGKLVKPPYVPGKIDYIFASPELAENAGKALLWEDCSDGIWLSDHYPIEVDIGL